LTCGLANLRVVTDQEAYGENEMRGNQNTSEIIADGDLQAAAGFERTERQHWPTRTANGIPAVFAGSLTSSRIYPTIAGRALQSRLVSRSALNIKRSAYFV
jgi:hypothetical protein